MKKYFSQEVPGWFVLLATLIILIGFIHSIETEIQYLLRAHYFHLIGIYLTNKSVDYTYIGNCFETATLAGLLGDLYFNKSFYIIFYPDKQHTALVFNNILYTDGKVGYIPLTFECKIKEKFRRFFYDIVYNRSENVSLKDLLGENIANCYFILIPPKVKEVEEYKYVEVPSIEYLKLKPKLVDPFVILVEKEVPSFIR